MKKLLFRSKEVAHLIGVTPDQLKLARHTGELFKGVSPPKYMKFGKAVRYHKREIIRWLRNRPTCLSTSQAIEIEQQVKKDFKMAKVSNDRIDPEILEPLTDHLLRIIEECSSGRHKKIFNLKHLRVLKQHKAVSVSILKRIARNRTTYLRELRKVWDEYPTSEATDELIKLMNNIELIELKTFEGRRYVREKENF